MCFKKLQVLFLIRQEEKKKKKKKRKRKKEKGIQKSKVANYLSGTSELTTAKTDLLEDSKTLFVEGLKDQIDEIEEQL